MWPIGGLALRCISRGIRSQPPPFPCRLLRLHTGLPSWVPGGPAAPLLWVDASGRPDGRSRRGLCAASGLWACWRCGAALGLTPAFFCPDCRVVQSPDGRATYFDIMGCDTSFAVDVKRLQQRYLHLQRRLHPDNFSQKSQREQEYSETQTVLVNKAYKTLLNPLSRGIYMLELRGMHLDEGMDSGADRYFLLEVMELNERLVNTQSREEASGIGLLIRGRLECLTEQINASFHKGDLQAAKGFLVQMKYFVNIEEKVKNKISESI